eukprot:SAG31_NODE_16150_length_721_cov_0.839228_1_plen_79_part_00
MGLRSRVKKFEVRERELTEQLTERTAHATAVEAGRDHLKNELEALKREVERLQREARNQKDEKEQLLHQNADLLLVPN